jgi:hypothetical protein
MAFVGVPFGREKEISGFAATKGLQCDEQILAVKRAKASEQLVNVWTQLNKDGQDNLSNRRDCIRGCHKAWLLSYTAMPCCRPKAMQKDIIEQRICEWEISVSMIESSCDCISAVFLMSSAPYQYLLRSKVLYPLISLWGVR